MMPRILFLADASPQIGGGHVMRSLSLAVALDTRGAACAVIEHPGAQPVLAAFSPDRIERLAADGGSQNELVAQSGVIADRWKADVVVVDHYGLNPVHETRLRSGGRRIAVIDDLARAGHDADLLIDPSFGRTAGDYEDAVRGGALVLAGPDYALLRPDYTSVRASSLARRASSPAPRRVLVALGLTDVRGVTGRVMQMLRPELADLETDVVVGAGAPSLPWLRHLQGSDPHFRVHVDTPLMANLMAAADIAVGAGGSSVWERACLGLPALNLILADNQRPLALALDEAGACLAIEAGRPGLGDELVAGFARLRVDTALRARMSEASARLCDGLGAARVADAMLALLG